LSEVGRNPQRKVKDHCSNKTLSKRLRVGTQRIGFIGKIVKRGVDHQLGKNSSFLDNRRSHQMGGGGDPLFLKREVIGEQRGEGRREGFQWSS